MSDAADADGSPEPVPDPHMLDLLICPVSKGRLEYDRAAKELISKKAGLAYPIRDGVPIMLEDEARRIDDTE
ncbi:MAG: Trm112 family protein [Pseudomonadota bacterium]